MTFTFSIARKDGNTDYMLDISESVTATALKTKKLEMKQQRQALKQAQGNNGGHTQIYNSCNFDNRPQVVPVVDPQPQVASSGTMDGAAAYLQTYLGLSEELSLKVVSAINQYFADRQKRP